VPDLTEVYQLWIHHTATQQPDTDYW